MSDYCNICDTRRPEGGTEHLVLNNGELWIEFCQGCGDTELKNPQTGEAITVRKLWERAKG